MPINTVIIEDEEKSLCVLKDFIDRLAPDLQVCGTAGHIDDAVGLILSTAPHLVFLDICIADGLGFDVLKRVPQGNFELICITAYDDYAIDAFQHAAVDYLLKPLGIQPFKDAVARVRKRVEEKVHYKAVEALLRNQGQQNSQDQKIGIPTINGCDFIDMKDILWCKSDGHYTTFYLIDKSRIMSTRNLGAYEEMLSHNNFFRIHHSAIINMRWIKTYIKGKGGYVVLTDGTELEISQRRKGEFLEKFQL
ncbi:LytR/AlgR family response regulator transcription factor [Puia dinghuensis]|uniref:DNA-binding response regulator n=1 Tax=Puia dinghuensis TaxID=1792502 RepID=A0A8J2U6R5_9BACT|nr:LytTR family DNA-binding domain-containing protein [Puia dinghuensis]GGA82766.1 DNA-binding response regulator [Puia dinghuensis]